MRIGLSIKVNFRIMNGTCERVAGLNSYYEFYIDLVDEQTSTVSGIL